MNTRITTRLEPAHTVIEAFSTPEICGATRLARLLKVNDSTVSRWRRSKGRRGTGGIVPAWWHRKIYDLAKRERVKLTWAQITGAPDGEK